MVAVVWVVDEAMLEIRGAARAEVVKVWSVEVPVLPYASVELIWK
jgi:hypothetical protein